MSNETGGVALRPHAAAQGSIMAPDPAEALATTLASARFEIIPMTGVEQQIAALPDGVTVTVTSSPRQGLNATLSVAGLLRQRYGFDAVPHLAARSIRDHAHLRDVLQTLTDIGVGEVFVVAGDDPQPAGPFDGSVALLPAMAELGHDLRVGITGYPESHAFIPDDTAIEAMAAKAPFADYIVSQICYDPTVTAEWVTLVRSRGVTLPIHIGLPGVVDFARLLRISRRVGIGDSLRFLRKQWTTVAKLLGGYEPDALVDGLAPLVADPHMRIAGWHLFTFNEVRATEAWRQKTLARHTSRRAV